MIRKALILFFIDPRADVPRQDEGREGGIPTVQAVAKLHGLAVGREPHTSTGFGGLVHSRPAPKAAELS